MFRYRKFVKGGCRGYKLTKRGGWWLLGESRLISFISISHIPTTLSLARCPAGPHVAVDRAAHGRRRVAAAPAEMAEVWGSQPVGGVNL
jgi:hypothetical protein